MIGKYVARHADQGQLRYAGRDAQLRPAVVLIPFSCLVSEFRPLLAQIKDSFDLPEAMRSYFLQLFPLNPSAIIPSGPTLADLGLEGAPMEQADTSDAFHRQAKRPVGIV